MYIYKIIRSFVLLLVVLFLALPSGGAMSSRKRDSSGRRLHTDSSGVTRAYDTLEKKWVVVETLSRTKVSSETTLLLEGPKLTGKFDFEKGEFRINDKSIVVSKARTTRDTEKQQDGDTGRTIWDGKFTLYPRYISRYEFTTYVYVHQVLLCLQSI